MLGGIKIFVLLQPEKRYCGFSSAGRAEASQASGRGFEPRNPLRQRKLSSVGSERLPYKQEVAGSNPAVSTIFKSLIHRSLAGFIRV